MESETSFQNMDRWPERPSACSCSCFSSQPFGVMLPTGSGTNASGASPSASGASEL